VWRAGGRGALFARAAVEALRGDGAWRPEDEDDRAPTEPTPAAARPGSFA
jgi:hypothetical protein